MINCTQQQKSSLMLKIKKYIKHGQNTHKAVKCEIQFRMIFKF